jgi:hypothetical protein
VNGAPQLFFSCRAPAFAGPADRARARHPAPRRAKNSTGAGRVPVRGEANSFSAGMANLAVRGCASRFFVLAARYFRLADRSTRWAEAGPAIFVFLAVRAFASGGQLGHRAAKTGEGKTQRSVLHLSPFIRPAAGVAEARAHPAQRIGVELPTPCSGAGNALPIRRLLVPQRSLNIHRWLRASASAFVVCGPPRLARHNKEQQQQWETPPASASGPALRRGTASVVWISIASWTAWAPEVLYQALWMM